MIKRAEKKDYERVVEYLDYEGSINTTLLAHIEKYGFEKDFQDVWLYFDEGRNTLAIIMRHFNSLYIYSRGFLYDIDELASFVSFIGADIISGKLDILSELSLELSGMVLEPSCHMIHKDKSKLVECRDVVRADLDDCRELAELIYSIPEFARFYSSEKEIERGIRRRIELGICRYFVLKRDGKIVSQAYTTIESSKYATIGGVVTRREYRNQGLASLVVSCICQDLYNSNKIPNLFFTNEEAGRVYEKLGFVHAGEYGMLLDHKYKIY
jgi:predicted GNAT family acetyltransferase